MNNMKNIIRVSVFLLFMTVTLPSAWAQPGPPATPIDGGLSLLLAAGGLYGLKRIRDHRSSH